MIVEKASVVSARVEQFLVGDQSGGSRQSAVANYTGRVRPDTSQLFSGERKRREHDAQGLAGIYRPADVGRHQGIGFRQGILGIAAISGNSVRPSQPRPPPQFVAAGRVAKPIGMGKNSRMVGAGGLDQAVTGPHRGNRFRMWG